MSATTFSSRFSWDPPSWHQSLLPCVWPKPQPDPTWIDELKKFDLCAFAREKMDSSPRSALEPVAERARPSPITILHKTIAYLADYPHPQLQQALVEKLTELPSDLDSIKNVFHSILLCSLATGRSKMWKVYQNALPFQLLLTASKVSNVMELAKIEAIVVPKPEHRFVHILRYIAQAWYQQSQYIRKIVQNIFLTTSLAYGGSLNTVPKNPQKAQGQWSFYRDAFYDIVLVVQILRTLLSGQRKASLVAMALIPFIVVAYQYRPLPLSTVKIFGFPEIPIDRSESGDEQLVISAKGVETAETVNSFEAQLMELEEKLNDLKIVKLRAVTDGYAEKKMSENWFTSLRGKEILAQLRQTERQIASCEEKLMEARKLSQRLERLKKIVADFTHEECTAIHSLYNPSKISDQQRDELQRVYLFLKYIALPVVVKEQDRRMAKYKLIIRQPSNLSARNGRRPRSNSASS